MGAQRPAAPIQPKSNAGANCRSEALAWREQWRTELAAGERDEAPILAPSQPLRRVDGGKQGADFAAHIARAEFGRFYWDARRDNELRSAIYRASTMLRPNGKARKK